MDNEAPPFSSPKKSFPFGILAIGILAGILVAGGMFFAMKGLPRPAQTSSASAALQTPVLSQQQDADLNATIDRGVATLVPKPRTIQLTSEKALAAKADILKGDYDGAQKIAAEVLANSSMVYGHFTPFNKFIEILSDPADETFLNHLNEWCAKYSQSPIPYMIRAQYYQQTGWRIRGNGFAGATSQKAMQTFRYDIDLAAGDALKAIKIDSDLPYPYYMLLDIEAANGNTDGMDDAFTRAAQKFPDYYGLYETRLTTLMPKWGGSVEEMYSFVDKYAGAASDTSPVKFLYLQLYSNLLNTVELACQSYKGDKKECMSAGMGKLATPALEKNIHNTLELYAKNDPYQFSQQFRRIMSDMMHGENREIFTGAILQLAASSMGGNNQLSETNPGHNNYVLDRITGDVWYNSQNYDNAEKKYEEALADIKETKFPTEEDRDLALGGLYYKIANVYSQNGNYIQSIIYLKAADAMGIMDSHGKCLDYFKLKDYPDAVKECTDGYAKTGDREALYWRARAEYEDHNPDAALADYTVVASSNNSWQGSAIINGSVIFGDRHDFQGMADWLNAHPTIFNESSTSETENTIAAVYNNRCYAYMQLGQLQKALDDCTVSLRHGSLPDAYQKQQELIKRLKGN